MKLNTLTGKMEVMKYGIADVIKNPNRNFNQLKIIQAIFPQYTGITTQTILETKDRATALFREAGFVTAHVMTFKKMPVSQFRPLPWKPIPFK